MTQVVNHAHDYGAPQSDDFSPREKRAALLAESYLRNGPAGALRSLVAVLRAELREIPTDEEGLHRRAVLARISGAVERDSRMLDMIEAAAPYLVEHTGSARKGWELAEHLTRNVMCATDLSAPELHRKLERKLRHQREKFGLEIADTEIALVVVEMVDAWRREER